MEPGVLDAVERDYRANGFAIAKGVIPRTLLDDVYSATVKVLARFAPACPPDLVKDTPWLDPRFHHTLTELRRIDPKMFGAFYDTLQVSLVVKHLPDAPLLLQIVERLLGEETVGLAATGHMLRMDPPHDARNSLEWHQESAYYQQNVSSSHGSVVWIPLHDMVESLGPVTFCRGSHLRGRLSIESSGKQNYETSEQFRIADDEIAKFESCPGICEAGDAVFFHMDIFHRSGRNVSDRFRFSGGARFHRIAVDDFVPGRLIYQPNEMMRQQLSERWNRTIRHF
ncbi:MAG: Phytanoyl-CoA dioxygenase (PhyH) [bacterium]|nr:Phytanoyl-CoA dioxygenase (PhyH) [bacterium]